MFSEYLKVSEALLLSFISITIVFCILLIIAFMIMSFKYIFKVEEKKANTAVASQQAPVINNTQQIVNLDEIEKDENKLVALLVASIASNENDEDKKYRVTNIKEI